MTKQQRAEANKATAESAEQGIAAALQESYAASVEGDMNRQIVMNHNHSFAAAITLQLLSPEKSSAAAKPAVDKAINPKTLFANYDSPANYDATPSHPSLSGHQCNPPGGAH